MEERQTIILIFELTILSLIHDRNWWYLCPFFKKPSTSYSVTWITIGMPQGKLCIYKHIYSVTSPHTRVLHSQICRVYYQKDLQVTNRTQLPIANNKNEKDNGLAK
jgi:hypothetical protein